MFLPAYFLLKIYLLHAILHVDLFVVHAYSVHDYIFSEEAYDGDPLYSSINVYKRAKATGEGTSDTGV